MKRKGRPLQVAAALVLLVVLAFGTVAAFQMVNNKSLSGISTRTPPGSPSPQVTVPTTADGAYWAKYGKLQPALYDRLQMVTADTVLPVAIKVSLQGARTEAELYAALAIQFPEAAKAMAEGKKPMDVEDPDLSEKIQQVYRQMRVEDVVARLQPLTDWLQERGFSSESYAKLESPSLTAGLPKRTILEVVTRDDVELISLVEEQIPSTPTAISSCGIETSDQLSFETIEQAKTAGITKQWKGTEPGLLIIAHPEDVSDAQQYVTDKATLILSQLDFTKYFAIIAFQGLQGVDRGGPFQIECIIRQERAITLYAQPINRDPSIQGNDIVVSPYHLVQVRKDGMEAGIFYFKLYFDKYGSEVASISYSLP